MPKCTVIILNYKRPINLRRHILPSLISNPTVDEIIISHGLVDTYFHGLAKTRHFKHFVEQERTGMLRKLTCATYANNECLMYLDDDILVEPPAINSVIKAWGQDKTIISGIFGRNCTKEKYVPIDVKETVAPIIGGRFLVCSRTAALQANDLAYVIDPYMYEHQVKWNGEDIFLSLVTLLHSKRLNRVVKAPFRNLADNDAISKMPNHYAIRTHVVQKCFEILPGLVNSIGGGYFD